NRIAMPTARWTKEGDFFHVRHHAWYYNRLAEIPDRVARSYEAQLRRRPQLGLEDAVRMALTLRDAQLRELDGVLGERGVRLGQVYRYQIAGEYPSGGREALRAFGSLSRPQQLALLAGQVFPCGNLPPPTVRWLRLALK